LAQWVKDAPVKLLSCIVSQLGHTGEVWFTVLYTHTQQSATQAHMARAFFKVWFKGPPTNFVKPHIFSKTFNNS